MLIWQEPWTNRGFLVDNYLESLQLHPVCNKSTTMSNMINNGGWVIPDFVRGQLARMDSVFEETEIQGGEDYWIWIATSSGTYTLKETYFSLCKTQNVWPWHSMVWFSQRIPWHSFVTWMALRGGLKTLARSSNGVWYRQKDVCCVGGQRRCQGIYCITVRLPGQYGTRYSQWQGTIT